MTFAADLKAWIRRAGYTRDGAAAALAVPRSTLDGWCAGRPPALEGSLRRLMELIEAHQAPPSSAKRVVGSWSRDALESDV